MGIEKMEALGREMYEIYTRGAFGSVLKTEIDTLVFHYFLRENLTEEYIVDGQIQYLKIDASEIYRLSKIARIKESIIKTKLETDYLKHVEESDEFGSQIFNEIIFKNKTFDKSMFKEGKIKLTISNPIFKKYLEQKLNELGGFIDYSFNRDLIVIELYYFFRLLEISDNSINSFITENIINQLNENDNYKSFITKISKKPLKDGLTDIVNSLGNKSYGDLAINIFELIGSFVQNRKNKFKQENS